MKSTDAIIAVRKIIETGRIIHAVDSDGCPITAGRVAVPGGDDRWSIFRYPPPGYGAGGDPHEGEDDCGTPAGVARVLVKTYLGAHKALEAASRHE